MSMTFRRKQLIASFMVSAALACADALASTDGRLISTDEDNPWFLENTAVVHYCVDLDEVNFGATRANSEAKIREALTYWQEEFSYALPTPAHVPVKVGTQQFLPVACDTKPELRFQLGKLSPEQAAQVHDPQHTVGMAVRERYDPEELRASGFVYLSPETGPLALADQDLITGRWSYEQILKAALIHVLGRVFGVSDEDSPGQDGLMASDALDTMIRMRDDLDGIPSFFPSIYYSHSIPRYFAKNHHSFLGKPSQAGASLFGVAADREIRIDVLMDKEYVSGIKIFSADKELGSIEIDEGLGDYLKAPRLALNPAQKVLPSFLWEHRNLFIRTRWKLAGTYTAAAGGNTARVFTEFTPDAIRMIGLSEPSSGGWLLDLSGWN